MKESEIRIEMKGKGRHSTWCPVSMEEFKSSLKVTREILFEEGDMERASHYNDDLAIDCLRGGYQIDTPMLVFRMSSGEVCPKCQNHFDLSVAAVSRRDNETRICPRCGAIEGMTDYALSKRGRNETDEKE